MKKLENLFNCSTYWSLNKNKTITITFLPNIEFSRDNYKSFYIYDIFIYWLWFGIVFKYTYYKKLK